MTRQGPQLKDKLTLFPGVCRNPDDAQTTMPGRVIRFYFGLYKLILLLGTHKDLYTVFATAWEGRSSSANSHFDLFKRNLATYDIYTTGIWQPLVFTHPSY